MICLSDKTNVSENSCVRDRLLFELVSSLGNSLSLDETLGELDRRLRPLVSYDAMAVWLAVEDRLAAAYVSGDEARHLPAPEIAAGSDAVARAASAFGGGLHSSLGMALERAGKRIGVLALYRRQADAFTAQDRAALSAVLTKAAAAIANAVRYEGVERQAWVDEESSLINRRGLFLRLDAEVARARRHHSGLAVLVCEIGRGAVPWRELAAGLRQSCREEDCLARMGAAVVLVLPGFAPTHLAEKRAQVERVAAGLALEIRVGAALFPDDGCYADDLLAAAGERRRPRRE